MKIYIVYKYDYEEHYNLAAFKNESNAIKYMEEQELEYENYKKENNIYFSGYSFMIEEILIEDM